MLSQRLAGAQYESSALCLELGPSEVSLTPHGLPGGQAEAGTWP